METRHESSRRFRTIDRFDGGCGWLAHPAETLQRAGHAFRGEDGVWVVDPVDAPGLDGFLAERGGVAGVAVCSNWHARDAGVVASRHDCPVTVPTWMDRVAERVAAPVERVDDLLGDLGFRVLKRTPLVKWREAILWRESDGTLYVPDSLGTVAQYTRGDEHLGASAYSALSPPGELLADLEPERVHVGHGEGVFENADEALAEALDVSRWRAVRLAVGNLGSYLREVTGRGTADGNEGRSSGC